MTGYGRAFYETKKRNLTIEIKSVNHRYLDLNIKMPRNLISLEERIRKIVHNKISRGKVDIYLTQTVLQSENSVAILNKTLSDSYVKCLEEIKNRYNLNEEVSVSLIAKFPEVINVEQKEEDLEEIWNDIQIPLTEAVNLLVAMRAREGQKLKEDVESKCSNISKMVEGIEEKSETVVEQYRKKLLDRVSELLGDTNVDENRIAMEVAILSDKACIDEEIVRLKSHILQLKDSLVLCEPIGRKLDFIVQEMNREANTISSKATDINIVQLILNIKNEIEKIREQIQNIE